MIIRKLSVASCLDKRSAMLYRSVTKVCCSPPSTWIDGKAPRRSLTVEDEPLRVNNSVGALSWYRAMIQPPSYSPLHRFYGHSGIFTLAAKGTISTIEPRLLGRRFTEGQRLRKNYAATIFLKVSSPLAESIITAKPPGWNLDRLSNPICVPIRNA